MTQSLRRLATLSLVAVLPALLAADEVQQLPVLTVTGPAGTRSAQPNLAALRAGADVSTGLDDVARHTAGFTVSDAGARGFGEITTLRGLSNRVLELGGESGTDAAPHAYPGSSVEYVERTGHEAPGVHA